MAQGYIQPNKKGIIYDNSVVIDNISISANNQNEKSISLSTFLAEYPGYQPIGIYTERLTDASSSGTYSGQCGIMMSWVTPDTYVAKIRNYGSTAAKVKLTAKIAFADQRIVPKF